VHLDTGHAGVESAFSVGWSVLCDGVFWAFILAVIARSGFMKTTFPVLFFFLEL
jgi:hypothetical protein